MTIQSQLDQVLALVDQFALTGRANWTHPKREVFANELRSRLSEIRAAVGGEAVAWPSVAKRVGDDWEARTALVTHSMSEAQANTWNACRAACVGAYSRATPFYTPPTATVDVGAMRRALTEYPDKNPQQSQAHKVCAGVLKLAASYAGEER